MFFFFFWLSKINNLIIQVMTLCGDVGWGGGSSVFHQLGVPRDSLWNLYSFQCFLLTTGVLLGALLESF